MGIVYHEIQASPDELRAEREGDDWDVSHGYASQVDVMMRRNPGMTRSQALAELARVKLEEAQLEKLEDVEDVAEGEDYPFGEAPDEEESKVIDSAISVVEKATSGALTVPSAQAILVDLYGFTPEAAARLLGVG